MGSKLAILVLIASYAWGQSGSGSQGSTYKTLFTNLTASSITTATVINIGQIGHQVTIVYKNAVGHTCTNPLTNGSLQFSYDNVTFVNFGSPQLIVGNLTPSVTSPNAQFLGSGVYPYVRFHLTSFDNTDCIASGFYSGTTASTILQNVQGGNPVGAFIQQSGISYAEPVYVGGVGGGGAGTMQPLMTCVNTSNITTTLGSSAHLLVAGSGSNGNYVHLCSLALSVDSASTVTISETSDGTCATGLSNKLTLYFASAGTFSWGNGLGSIFNANTAGDVLCITATGSGNVSAMANWLYF